MSGFPSAAGVPITGRLMPHPASPDVGIRSLDVTLERCADGSLSVRYTLSGSIDRLVIPGRSARVARRDGLWRHTCFELFVGTEHDTSYREYNLAPSGEWAAYAFQSYRERIPFDGDEAPAIEVSMTPSQLDQRVRLAASMLPAAGMMHDGLLAISTVLEARDGAVAYWALAHAPGQPDFHHRAGFVLRLPPL